MAKKKSHAVGRRLTALAVALFLVTTSMGVGGPIGVASASHEECSEVDEFFWVLSIGFMNEHCDSAELSQHATELEELHENATETEVYNTGAQLEAGSKQYLAVMDNYLLDSGTPAMAKAEAAAVEAIDEGKTRSEVEQAAVDAVQDYYTKKQMNLNDKFVVVAETVGTMENTTDLVGLSDTFIYPETGDRIGKVDGGTNQYDDNLPPVTDHTVDYINGTTGLSRNIYAATIVSGGNDIHSRANLEEVTSDGNGGKTVELHTVHVSPIDGEPGFVALNITEYRLTWSEIESKSGQIELNAEEYAGSLYNQTQNGTANVSDYVSGATLAQEYATSYNDTGFYSYLVGYSATQGMAIPDLENTSLMTIQTATDTYQGLLMSQEAPSGGVWEVGTTYHTADIGGKQFVATTNGSVVELDGEFSITSMEGPEGQEVQTTTSQEYNYTITNESADYSELQEDLRALRQEIEDIEPPGGSGGGGDGGLGLDLGLGGTGILIAAAAAAVILLGRN